MLTGILVGNLHSPAVLGCTVNIYNTLKTHYVLLEHIIWNIYEILTTSQLTGSDFFECSLNCDEVLSSKPILYKWYKQTLNIVASENISTEFW